MNYRSCAAGWSLRVIAGMGLLLSHTMANAAGISVLELPAAGKAPALQAVLWTPCAKPAVPVQMGVFTLQGLRGCDVAGKALPLIVVSHGKGGSAIGHHDTASALADAGFVVAALSHPGDSFGDDSASQELAIFESRPHDISRLVSYMTEQWPHRNRLNADAVGAFGFSRGGYTVLALSGAVPNLQASAERFCSAWWSFAISLCRQLADDDAQLRPQTDPRIRAAVVVDPLNLFDATAFGSVRIPVQLWASELGGDAVELPHIEAIKAALPQPPEYQVAQGAGHFAYLAPCPAELAEQAEEICVDPAGFDRIAWHQKMNADVVSFFQKNLGSSVEATER